MDIDAMGKHVQGLLGFKKEFEQLKTGLENFLQNAGHDVGAEAGATSIGERVAVVEAHLTEVADAVARIQQQLESLPDLVEGLSGLKDLAAWFAENRSGLEVLLSIGDEPASGGAGSPTGAVSDAGGTEGTTGAPNPSPAS